MENETEIQRQPEHLEEQEWVLGGTKADEWWTLDINHAFIAEYAKWKKAAQAEPENCKITYEDPYHMIVKVRRKALRLPGLKTKGRALTPEQKAASAARLAAARQRRGK